MCAVIDSHSHCCYYIHPRGYVLPSVCRLFTASQIFTKILSQPYVLTRKSLITFGIYPDPDFESVQIYLGVLSGAVVTILVWHLFHWPFSVVTTGQVNPQMYVCK